MTILLVAWLMVVVVGGLISSHVNLTIFFWFL